MQTELDLARPYMNQAGRFAIISQGGDGDMIIITIKLLDIVGTLY